MNRTCHTRRISELTTTLERVPYTANAHPMRGRGRRLPPRRWPPRRAGFVP